jgi:hypothetical protein
MTTPSRRTLAERLALAMLSALLFFASTSGAQAAPRTGVFDDANEISRGVSRCPSPSHDDERLQWLTFYLIFTDDELSRYAPGGAMGARFDLFQHAGFSGSQPAGYAIHIVVRNGRTRLTGMVGSARDRVRAEQLARSAAGTIDVANALSIAQQEQPE